MIASGLQAHLATVDLKKLPAEFAGRTFDAQLLADLPEGIDPCGENGEFHTCVVAGPMFSRRLDVTTGGSKALVSRARAGLAHARAAA